MRFGIMDMQLDLLVQVAGPASDVVSQVAGFDHAGLVFILNKAGFNLVELGGDLTLFFPGAFSPQSIDRLLRLKMDRGMAYTVHLRLWSVEPSTLMFWTNWLRSTTRR